ncbi:endonuclease [Formosa agariphila KMM 3901]|uniref:Endonuclease n=1 Tax=Formosa agariphila (strain DSM 15362 / KCTC 12365 / LMG 23005 / KMM 3901 / M-2Alg 35-1) TaxID=1347342 RepID=T2KPU6_FORAG|nr:hypothetical protein [Formosa agariphila]CDF80837.1 endonuclease [Formosa agariphila KMM 3901]
MKIATFNIQNLFHRDKNLIHVNPSKNLKDWISELDNLMTIKHNSEDQRDRIKELSFLIGFEKTIDKPYAVLRRRAGHLYLKGIDHSLEHKASYLNYWNGWITLQTTPIPYTAVEHKARLIADINADVLLLQEVEDRGSLEEFNHQILPKFYCEPYTQCIVVQSNKYNGLEMGILLRQGYNLLGIKTHQDQNFIQYDIETPKGKTIHIINLHLDKPTTDLNQSHFDRKLQTNQVANIYNQLLLKGLKNIIITGTLQVPSYCDSLSPLFKNTTLKEVTKHLSFEVVCDHGSDRSYYRLGAYRKGVNIKQKDYMLVSPNLWKSLKDSGMNRKAMWPPHRPHWTVYPSLKHKGQAASEHPIIWAKLKL